MAGWSRRSTLLVLAGLTAVLTALSTTGEPGGTAQAQEQLRTPRITAVLIAQYDEGVGDAALLREVEADLNFEVLREYANLPLVSIALLADIDPALIIRDRLLPIEGVVAVTEDIPVPTLLRQSVPLIGASHAHDVGFDGTGTTIAVMDTGADASHPFLAGRIIEEACFSTAVGENRQTLCPDGTAEQQGTGSSSSETAACYDGANHVCSHGPHVTGIAAGDGSYSTAVPPSGVAPGADIVSYQVFYRVNDAAICDSDWPPDPDDPNPPEAPDPDEAPCVRSLATDRIAAIDHLLDLVDDGLDVVALNVSIGGGQFNATCPEEPEEVAYAALRAAGVIPVVAAGNDGFGQAVNRPACAPSALRVGNTDKSDVIEFRSNRGALLDVFAPGVTIWSSIGGTNFGPKGGTSMSAPHVAGALAVLAQAHPTLPTATLEAALIDSGLPITYASGAGSTLGGNAGSWTQQVTTPRIDLRRALMELAGVGPLEVTSEATQVTVDEGDLAEVTGTRTGGMLPVEVTASYGTVEHGGQTWVWRHRPVDGPPDSREVTITATDAFGATEQVSFSLEVNNVAPAVVFADSSWDRPLPGSPTPLDVVAIDPGVLDFNSGPFGVEVDCDANRPGQGVTAEGVGIAGTEVLPTFTTPLVEASIQGTCRTDLTEVESPFTVRVTVTDKDGDSHTADHQVRWFDLREGQIRRFDVESPVARWLEARTVVQQAERELLLDLDVFGPPDLDLDLTWRWGDGATTEVGHPLGRDEDLAAAEGSSAFRGVRTTATHSWREPGLYPAVLEVRAGEEVLPANELTVVVTGTETSPRDTDEWEQHLDRLPRSTVATEVTIAAVLSPSIDEAIGVDGVLALLDTDADPTSVAGLRAALATAWLNVAAGAVHLDTAFTFDGHTGPVASLLLDAEALLTRSSVPPATIGVASAALASLNAQGAQAEGEDAPAGDAPAGDAPAGDDAPTSSFLDVDPDNVHAAAIAWLVEAGITEGFADGTFRPGAPVTRQQMASFLTRAFDYPIPVEVARFTDVGVANVHRDTIAALAEQGVTQGCTADRFCPGDPVTRAQMASFLTRALGYEPPSSPPSFVDVPATNVHRDAIGSLAEQGVTQGCTADRYCPSNPVTRGQMASFLMRALADAVN